VKYGALTFIDECHGTGVFGETGRYFVIVEQRNRCCCCCFDYVTLKHLDGPISRLFCIIAIHGIA